MGTDGDIGVDVLIIGGGIQGLYLARALDRRYSVCLVTDPDAPSETLDSPGYFSAGYDGNDVARIQPARRAAGYWGLWAESNGIPHNSSDNYYVLAPEAESTVTRLWGDASLQAKPAIALPQLFARGTLEGMPAYLVEEDVVISPTRFMAELRDGLDDSILYGRVERFLLATDAAIDIVEVQVGNELVQITPRFVVLASNVGNGSLMAKIVARFRDDTRRRDAGEKVRTCQAVRRRLTVAIRGSGLPTVAGVFGGLHVASHDVPDSDERVLLVSPPFDDRQTVLGPEEVRFEPKVDPEAVASTIEQLFAISPDLADRAGELRWSAFVARKTEHPSMAVPDATDVPQPAPAKLETLDMTHFIAMWPSHLAYSMIVGDVVAERVEQALGDPGDFSGGAQASDFAEAAPSERMTARWERQGFDWHDWAGFAESYDIKVG